MHREPKDPLANWADRALKQLPERRAPTSLAPGVLAALRKRAIRPWYRRPWLSWPRGMQVISALLTGGVFASLIWGFGLAEAAAAPMVHGLRSDASNVLSILGTLGQAVSLAAGRVPIMAWTALGAVLMAAWVGCLGLGTACWRLTASRH